MGLLMQCMNCGHGGWTDHELKQGLCPGCQEEDENDYDEEYYESQPHEDCPKCGRTYDDIDFDYQSCSKCGWDVEKKMFNEKICREPNDSDYANGDADIISGHWN